MTDPLMKSARDSQQTFDEWLLGQCDRRDWVGHLALDTAEHVQELAVGKTKIPLPNPGEGKAGWKRFLERYAACWQAHAALDLAWREWSLTRGRLLP